MINKVYKIKVDDLTIRCYEKSDAPKTKEAIDNSLEHLHEFMEWSHSEPETIKQKEKRIQKWRKSFLNNEDYTYGIFRNEKQVGSTGFHTRIGENKLEIGYWVRADETNKGIATKISVALIIAAFTKIEVESVEIHCEIKNILSKRIPIKLKMKQEENYFHETRGENCIWSIDKDLFTENESFYNTLFDKIDFYDVDGILV